MPIARTAASAATSRPTPRRRRFTKWLSIISCAGARKISVGDMVYFQGHATPGIYARAFLEGRLDEQHLQNFRQELAEGGGLVVVSASVFDAGLLAVPDRLDGPGPDPVHLSGAVQSLPAGARLHQGEEPKVWAFIGDGETDEPETLGSLTLAARENLDNLIWVINCNLQRLDGPVRGNGKIIQELEAAFRGAGWNVIKVIWGSDWDDLLARGQDRPAAQAHGGSGGRRLPEIFRRAGQLHAQTFLRQISRTAQAGESSDRRADSQAAARRPRHAQSLCGLQSGDGTQRASRRSFWPKPSRATASAKRAKAATSRTSKKAERKGAARVPRALRHSDQRRGHRGDAVLPSARRTARRRSICSNGARSSAVFCRSAKSRPSRSTCRSWISSPSFSKARAASKFRRRWRSCGC